MANTNPFKEATKVLGEPAGSTQNNLLNDQLTSITQQLQQLEGINQTQIQTMLANTQAVAQNTSVKSQGAESAAKSVANTLQSVFGLGLGFSPLISGLVSLFGGGGPNAPTPLIPYAAPLPIGVEAGTSSSAPGVFGIDTAAGGLPRPTPAQSAANITVQVQAIDSQSFLDHSNDIAQAVRQAMLTSTTLNDVIRGV